MAHTLYQRVAADLRREIVDGQIGPGGKLPTEPELTKRFGVSRNTVRQATRLLIEEGLIKSVRGRLGGMVVRKRMALTFHASDGQHPERPRSESRAVWFAEVRQMGLTPAQDFECRNVTLPDDVALRLGEPEGTAGVLRRRVRYANGDPLSIQDSYYPTWLADEVPELRSPKDLDRGTASLLAERGHSQVGYLDHNSARMPTPEEARLLDIGPGTPVLVKTRTGYTAIRAVRATIETMVGDTNRVEYEIGDLSATRRSG